MKKMRKGAGRILALLLSFMVIAGMLPEAAQRSVTSPVPRPMAAPTAAPR